MSRGRKGARGGKGDALTLALFDAAERAPAVAVPDAEADSSAVPPAVRAVASPEPALPGVDHAREWLAGAFARRLVDWARAAGAPEHALDALRRAGFAASMATASGHACTTLDEIEAGGAALATPLAASRMVGTPTAPEARPLVLDEEGRLYLGRYFDYEVRIARSVAARRPRVLAAGEARALAATLDALFGAGEGSAPDWQKLAAALGVLNGFTVISGGPGTGKTTTVVNLLAALLTLEPECRIALAAPTGKAAARMQQAIRARAAALPPEVQGRLPQEAFTIHRLLGVLPDGNGFRHGPGNPLAVDVLVVDEASMLDVALAAKLFDAVPDGARIVLLGDKDQLAAVESGAVFSELSADPRLTADCAARLSHVCGVPATRIVPPAGDRRSPLADRVVWFTRNFRFAADSGIGTLAAHVRAGDADAALATLRAPADASLAWQDDTDAALAPVRLATLCQGYAAYVASVAAYRAAPAGGRDPRDALGELFDAFDGFRVLCAERVGARGVVELNAALTRALRPRLEGDDPAPPRSAWYRGRPVMVLRNDYVLRLFNGDIGIALPDAAGNLLVHFRDTAGTVRALAPVRLPAHEDAFASTVHKAQGSEFAVVALVLPGRVSRVLTRELLYTGVTRARKQVTIVAGEDALRTAIVSPTVRHSGLLARLREVS